MEAVGAFITLKTGQHKEDTSWTYIKVGLYLAAFLALSPRDFRKNRLC